MSFGIQIGTWQEMTNKERVARGLKAHPAWTFQKDGRETRHIRCPICGEYMSFEYSRDKPQFIHEGKWDFRKDRLKHCGRNTTCRDYVAKAEAVEKKRALLKANAIDELMAYKSTDKTGYAKKCFELYTNLRQQRALF